MKKIVLIFIAVFCTLSMTSCSKKINNEFFGKDTLSNYALSLSFPNPNADTPSLVGDENLFVYLTEVEYKSYSKSVYDYLGNERESSVIQLPR